MGNAQPSKLMDTSQLADLSFLENGEFSKIYKGELALKASPYEHGAKQKVTIKVPRVSEKIRKDRSKLMSSQLS